MLINVFQLFHFQFLLKYRIIKISEMFVTVYFVGTMIVI